MDGTLAYPDDVVVEANRISDFEKGGGDTISYAAFLKGNSKDGVFERNLVVCSEHFSGGVRVGLSFRSARTVPAPPSTRAGRCETTSSPIAATWAST